MKEMKKGQYPLIGAFIGLMVVVIVGLSVVIPVIQEQITNADSITAYTQTGVTPTNGSTTTLSDGDLIVGTFQAVNGTSGEAVPAANYTLSLGTQGTAGTVAWLFEGTNVTGGPTAGSVNMTYSVYDATYIKNRTVVTLLNLIPLFLVLAILIGAVMLIRM